MVEWLPQSCLPGLDFYFGWIIWYGRILIDFLSISVELWSICDGSSMVEWLLWFGQPRMDFELQLNYLVWLNSG